MKKSVAHNLVIIAVLVVAIGIIFMNSSFKFTGNVVLDNYANQSDCESAGYTWGNLTECEVLSNCTICETDCIENSEEIEICTEGCVLEEDLCVEGCEQTCEEGDLDCILCETDCIENSEEIEICTEGCVLEEDLCVEGCEEDCSLCDENWGCTGDICDSTHLNLCLDETSCTNATGYWYDEICNVEEECVPETCESLNYDCGNIDNGCGTTLLCGECEAGYNCNAGACNEQVVSNNNDNSEGEENNNEKVKSTTIVSRATTNICTPEWTCTDWSDCTDGTQERTCTDSKNCDSQEGMPEISKSCQTCFDGIQNQDEEGVDCGGICEKKCSTFTILGGVINGPIESGKEFFLEHKVRSIVLLVLLICLIGGLIALKVFWKQVKTLNITKIKNNFNKFVNQLFHKNSLKPSSMN